MRPIGDRNKQIPKSMHRRQSWEVWGSRLPTFLAGGREGIVARGMVAGGRMGRGRIVKYYYNLSCTGSMFESGEFWREVRIICSEGSCKYEICLDKRKFKSKWLKTETFYGESNFFENLPCKILKFVGNLPWKIDFFTRIHNFPDFKPDWRQLPKSVLPQENKWHV